MRGMLGVMLLGGMLFILGAVVKRNRRSWWEILLDRGISFIPRLYKGKRMNIARMAKSGRRIVRNLNWA